MEVPKNTLILTPEPAPKKPRVRSKPAPKQKLEEQVVNLMSVKEPVPEPVVVKDQRTVTAQSGRRTRLPKPGSEGGVPISQVDYTVIKDTKEPLAVRDQLMREYFASQKHTDELVQKLCALVFKHH